MFTRKLHRTPLIPHTFLLRLLFVHLFTCPLCAAVSLWIITLLLSLSLPDLWRSLLLSSAEITFDHLHPALSLFLDHPTTQPSLRLRPIPSLITANTYPIKHQRRKSGKKKEKKRKAHLQGLCLVWLIALDYGSMRGCYIRSSLFENKRKADDVKPVLNLQYLLGSRLNSGKYTHVSWHNMRFLGIKSQRVLSRVVCINMSTEKTLFLEHVCVCVQLLVGMSHLKAPESCRQMKRSRSKPS